MKAQQENVRQKTYNRSFTCYEVSVERFDLFWHYHPEYELTYILEGKGKRFVGDSYHHFEKGDLVLIGPNLPHSWVSDTHTNNYEAKAIVLQFPAIFLNNLLQIPELQPLKQIENMGQRGAQIGGESKEKIVSRIQKLMNAPEQESIPVIIELLSDISNAGCEYLTTVGFQPIKGEVNNNRINIVFSYIHQHYNEDITLKQVANLVSLSESAFSKFFKRATGKTFSDYLNEVRIGSASQLLIETDLPIATIAARVGFENTTYFNRIFLRKHGIQPSLFRKLVLTSRTVQQ